MEQKLAERPPVTQTDDALRIQGQMVKVLCGKRSVTDRYSGYTVAQVRAELAATLNIPAGGPAILNGDVVANDKEGETIVLPEKLEFVQVLRAKG